MKWSGAEWHSRGTLDVSEADGDDEDEDACERALESGDAFGDDEHSGHYYSHNTRVQFTIHIALYNTELK